MVLEYEIEFPKSLGELAEGDLMPELPGGICDIDMPELPGSVKEPQADFNVDLECIPRKLVERAKIPDMPKTIWEEKKFRLGKPLGLPRGAVFRTGTAVPHYVTGLLHVRKAQRVGHAPILSRT